MKKGLIYILLLFSLAVAAQKRSPHANSFLFQQSLLAADTVIPEPGFSSGYQALLTYASNSGITLPSAEYRTAQDELHQVVSPLRIDHMLMAIHDQEEFALLNWMDPDSNKAINSGATFNTNSGFVTTVNSVGINTRYKPTTDKRFQKVDTTTFGIWLENISASSSYIAGFNGAGDLLIRYFSGNIEARINGSASSPLAATLTDSTGLLVMQRIGTLYHFYFNGTYLGQANHAGATGAVSEGNVYLHTMNSGGFGATVTYPIGGYFIGGRLSAQQITDVSNAWKTYYETVRNVEPAEQLPINYMVWNDVEAKASAESFTLPESSYTTDLQTLISTASTPLKSKLDGFYISSNGNMRDFARINIARPEKHLLQLTDAVEISNDGYYGGLITTGYNPFEDKKAYSQAGASIFTYVSNIEQTLNTVFGQSGTTRSAIRGWTYGTSFRGNVNGTEVTFAFQPDTLQGLLIFNRRQDTIDFVFRGRVIGSAYSAQGAIRSEEFKVIGLDSTSEFPYSQPVFGWGGDISAHYKELNNLVENYLQGKISPYNLNQSGGSAPPPSSCDTCFSQYLVNEEAMISESRLVVPDTHELNYSLEPIGGYSVVYDEIDDSLFVTTIHNGKDAFDYSDVTFQNGKLTGQTTHQHFYNHLFQIVRADWRRVENIEFFNYPTRVDTLVFYDNGPSNFPNASGQCSTNVKIEVSKNGVDWVNISVNGGDTIPLNNYKRFYGIVTNDTAHYLYLRWRYIYTDPNGLQTNCDQGSPTVKLLISGSQKPNRTIEWIDHETEQLTGVDKQIPWNQFSGTNSFQVTETDRETDGWFGSRIYGTYASYQEIPGDMDHIGEPFFWPSSANRSYNPSYSPPYITGSDGLRTRYVRGHWIPRLEYYRDSAQSFTTLLCTQKWTNAPTWTSSTHAYNRTATLSDKWSTDIRYSPSNNYLGVPYEHGPSGSGSGEWNAGYTEGTTTRYYDGANEFDFRNAIYSYWNDSTWGYQKGVTYNGFIYDRNYDRATERIINYVETARLTGWQAQYFANPRTRDSLMSDPRTYRNSAVLWYEIAATVGPRKVNPAMRWITEGQDTTSGHNFNIILEGDNEPDRDWHGGMSFRYPEWLAAEFSAMTDGHLNTIPNYNVNNPCSGALSAGGNEIKLALPGTTSNELADAKRFLDFYVGIRQKTLDSLHAEGIYLNECTGDSLVVLPPNIYVNFHHYSGTSGGQSAARYIKFPNETDDKGLVPEADGYYEDFLKFSAFLQSHYPTVKIICTEWGYDNYSGSKFGPHRKDIGIYNPARAAMRAENKAYWDSVVSHEVYLKGDSINIVYDADTTYNYYRTKEDSTYYDPVGNTYKFYYFADTATRVVDRGDSVDYYYSTADDFSYFLTQSKDISEIYFRYDVAHPHQFPYKPYNDYIYRTGTWTEDHIVARDSSYYYLIYGDWDMVEGYGLFQAQAAWNITGLCEWWFAGLDKMYSYWLADYGTYFDYVDWDGTKGVPNHEAKWLEGDNDANSFTGTGYYANPSYGLSPSGGQYREKTSLFTLKNFQNTIGPDAYPVERKYYTHNGRRVKSYKVYSPSKGKYSEMIFAPDQTYTDYADFEISLPAGATNIQKVEIVEDDYEPTVTNLGTTTYTGRVWNVPFLIQYEL